MPPHCDTRDGPVATAAQAALAKGNVNLALIWVGPSYEHELREAFGKARAARAQGTAAKTLADEWFIETAVRLHRATEGAPYTGLKPAGLDEGPVVPLAEEAIASGDATEVYRIIVDAIDHELRERFNRVIAAKNYQDDDVQAGRAYVEAFLQFVVYAHQLFETIEGHGHHADD